jgi:hypothetical protein
VVSAKTFGRAVEAVEKAGILLVYPIKNAPEPASIWAALYPRSEMRWDWSEDADPRVVDLWHLKTELGEGDDVVYAKWFQGRATFFSRALFPALLRVLGTPQRFDDAASAEIGLGPDARTLYQLLLEDSPQTVKMLRAAADLEGKTFEATYNRGMRELWSRLLIVGAGEIEEGSYPSLAMYATKHRFEDLWEEAKRLSPAEAEARVAAAFAPGSPWEKHLRRLRRAYGP